MSLKEIKERMQMQERTRHPEIRALEDLLDEVREEVAFSDDPARASHNLIRNVERAQFRGDIKTTLIPILQEMASSPRAALELLDVLEKRIVDAALDIRRQTGA